MYSQSILDEIRERLSVVSLIGERLPLKKAGRNYKGLCPFHSEKTPSFMVSEEKKIYHCFGCGEGGNIFNFFMKLDGLSFRDAVTMLANRAGIKLPQQTVTKEEEDEASRKKRWALRLNKLAAQYFHDNLLDEVKGAVARNYLKSRGINNEIITQHFLGYAENSWDALTSFLVSKKVPLDLAQELGLIKKKDERHYDFFRHRVMYPVITRHMAETQVLGFSARTLEKSGDEAKYINSPDSILYHKSHALYGLDPASVRREDQAIIVEGNMDLLSLHQFGFTNAVAPLGTALTSGHIRLLKRSTDNFVVIFDGDDAGRRAAKRSLPLFLETDLVPKVVVLPDGEDPDSFVKKVGAEGFKNMIDKAVTLFEWVIDETATECKRDTAGKVRAVSELRPLFAQLGSPIEASIYRQRLADRLGVREDAVAVSLRSDGRAKGESPVMATAVRKPAERTIVELTLLHPEIMPELVKNVDVSAFRDGAYQTMMKILMDEYSKTGSAATISRLEIADPEVKAELLSLAFAEDKFPDPIQVLTDCLSRLRRESLEERLQQLNQSIKTAEEADDEGALRSYMLEKTKITRELHKRE